MIYGSDGLTEGAAVDRVAMHEKGGYRARVSRGDRNRKFLITAIKALVKGSRSSYLSRMADRGGPSSSDLKPPALPRPRRAIDLRRARRTSRDAHLMILPPRPA